MAHPLSALAMAQGIAEGLTDGVSKSVRAEAEKRCSVARDVLGDILAPQEFDGLHVWAPMETDRARDIVMAAARRNITLAPPAAFLVDPQSRQSGLRFCLGTLSEADLERTLKDLKELLSVRSDANLDFGPVA